MSVFSKPIWLQLACLLLLTAVIAPASTFAEDVPFNTTPTLNDGKKWRIAYYEGGPYIEFQKGLSETVRGLMELGWIERAELPAQSGEETETMWRWLSEQAKSDYLEFLPNGHYSSAWDENVRERVSSEIMQRLSGTHNVDLMLAMGTWAGKDLANDEHDTPTLVFFASDPVAAGIINSIDDSGFAHVHAAFDDSRNERQVRIFHEMINFRRLGVAYEDSVDGRSYGGIEAVEKAAEKLGFELVRCYTVSDSGDDNVDAESVKKCFHELAPKVDAIYVTQQGGIRLNSIPHLVSIANQYNIPTFSQAGSEEVKYGFLVSISQASFSYIGKFHAQTIASVFNGVQPNDISQRLTPPPKIAINLKSAEIIGFDPPILILGAADEIYDDIVAP